LIVVKFSNNLIIAKFHYNHFGELLEKHKKSILDQTMPTISTEY